MILCYNNYGHQKASVLFAPMTNPIARLNGTTLSSVQTRSFFSQLSHASCWAKWRMTNCWNVSAAGESCFVVFQAMPTARLQTGKVMGR